ncbi:DUF692 family multinuclear iron-containing protein [Chitinophaga solisilvae]|uniref:multinuclear nonheme iron-dependent oxidase n=1 Tax=Chitinophaga solisilvae TaxID=1233460 RepID=UPI001F35FF93|nr:DUF692 family multinuclear iron-containing protein [Chitinophaga solisilvae]
MPEIRSAVACNLDANILAACLPLMEASKIEAIEWSFDALYKVKDIPDWFVELLTAFSNENRLIGHGIFFSLFSGRWRQEQEQWLQHLRKTSTHFRFDHITEHFGFMTGKDFHHGAPLNIPYTKSTLNIGVDRLKRIHDACRCPVGLENLAFSYSMDEVKRHGAFLDELLEPVNGFIILDLHNLYCQLHNFDITFGEMIILYPLHKVREIHISGGSWEASPAAPERMVRRDTHDDAVPEEVFQLLQKTIPLCPNLQYVVLEQLGTGLDTDTSRTLFRQDFGRMQRIVHEQQPQTGSCFINSFMPDNLLISAVPAADETLFQQQLELSAILESASSCEAAVHALQHSSLAHSDWLIEQWQPYMIETAVSIAQKWKKI